VELAIVKQFSAAGNEGSKKGKISQARTSTLSRQGKHPGEKLLLLLAPQRHGACSPFVS
jgi:hypothetical protein